MKITWNYTDVVFFNHGHYNSQINNDVQMYDQKNSIQITKQSLSCMTPLEYHKLIL